MAQSGMKELNKIVNAFTVYKFIQSIITPFTAMPAYKLGIIDRKGNFLKKQDDLKTDAEKKASSMFSRLIINLKKIIAKVPDPKMQAQLKTLPTAIFLVKEDLDEIGADITLIEEAVIKVLEENGVEIKNQMLNESFESKDTLEPGSYKTINENEFDIKISTKAIDYILGVPIFRINNSVVSYSEISPPE